MIDLVGEVWFLLVLSGLALWTVVMVAVLRRSAHGRVDRQARAEGPLDALIIVLLVGGIVVLLWSWFQ